MPGSEPKDIGKFFVPASIIRGFILTDHPFIKDSQHNLRR
jgi:hypothetical protein